MTRYYNENPQVTLWREKYEQQLEDYYKLMCEFEDVSDSIDYVKHEVEQTTARAKEAFQNFNSLPWFRKMFYRFNI